MKVTEIKQVNYAIELTEDEVRLLRLIADSILWTGHHPCNTFAMKLAEALPMLNMVGVPSVTPHIENELIVYEPAVGFGSDR